MKIYHLGFDQGEPDALYARGILVDGSNEPVQNVSALLNQANMGTAPECVATIKAAYVARALEDSWSITSSDIVFVDSFLLGFADAPQAAIADAPADAVTNYNVVTTVLGTLTGAVNTANTKQNEIATKLNTLLAELRTLGLIAS